MSYKHNKSRQKGAGAGGPAANGFDRKSGLTPPGLDIAIPCPSGGYMIKGCWFPEPPAGSVLAAGAPASPAGNNTASLPETPPPAGGAGNFNPMMMPLPPGMGGMGMMPPMQDMTAATAQQREQWQQMAMQQQMGMGMPPGMRPGMPMSPSDPNAAGFVPDTPGLPQGMEGQHSTMNMAPMQMQMMMQMHQHQQMAYQQRMMHMNAMQHEQQMAYQRMMQMNAMQQLERQGQQQPPPPPQQQQQQQELAPQYSPNSIGHLAPRSPTVQDKYISGTFFESDIVGSEPGAESGREQGGTAWSGGGAPQPQHLKQELPEMLRRLALSPSELSQHSTKACSEVSSHGSACDGEPLPVPVPVQGLGPQAGQSLELPRSLAADGDASVKAATEASEAASASAASCRSGHAKGNGAAGAGARVAYEKRCGGAGGMRGGRGGGARSRSGYQKPAVQGEGGDAGGKADAAGAGAGDGEWKTVPVTRPGRPKA